MFLILPKPRAQKVSNMAGAQVARGRRPSRDRFKCVEPEAYTI
jgi:hypothetical protein